MILYRIAKCNYARDVSGTGAKLFGGRWNSINVPLHYMASSRALAALEVLANQTIMRNSRNFCLTVFDLPENSIKIIDPTILPENWRQYPAIPELKQIGDDFVKKGEFLLLRVPSAIITEEDNFLMNVAHPMASKLKILEVKPFFFDERLF